MYSIFISASVNIVINEEKLVALLVFFSFRRVATSSLRRISVSTSSGSHIIQVERKRRANRDSLRL